MAPARSKTANVSWCISTRARSSCPSVTRVSAKRTRSRAPPSLLVPPVGADGTLVHTDVVPRHAAHREALLELLPAPRPIGRQHRGQRRDRLVHRVDDGSGDSGTDHLRDPAPAKGQDGGATGERLDHHQAEGFRPVDGKEERQSLPQQLDLFPVAQLAEPLDSWRSEQRLDLLLEVRTVGRVDLRSDDELKPRSTR